VGDNYDDDDDEDEEDEEEEEEEEEVEGVGKPCGAVFICDNPSSKELNDIKSEIGWRHVGPKL